MRNKIVYSICEVKKLQGFFIEYGLYLPENQNVISLSAELDDEIIGYSVISTKNGEYFGMYYLFVIPMMRGMGVGSALLNYAINYFRIHFPQKKLVIHYCSNNEKIRSFFVKNKLPEPEYDSTYYVCNYKKWLDEIFPIYQYVNYENFTFYKEYQELSDDEKKKVVEVVKNNEIPNYLNPFLFNDTSINLIRLILFDQRGGVIGWTCGTINNKKNFKILITYICPEFRKYRMGIYLWSCLYTWCFNYGKDVKIFSFDFDKRNTKLYNFYHRLVGKVISSEYDNYIIRV